MESWFLQKEIELRSNRLHDEKHLYRQYQISTALDAPGNGPSLRSRALVRVGGMLVSLGRTLQAL